MILVFIKVEVLLLGNLLQGIGIGQGIVFSLRFINSCSPNEIKGPSGGMFQLSILFGILICSIISSCLNDRIEVFFMVFSLQFIAAVLQMLIFTFCNKYSTPVQLAIRQDRTLFEKFFKNLYTANIAT